MQVKCLICETPLKKGQKKYCSKSCSCRGTQSWKTRESTILFDCRVCISKHKRKNSPFCSIECANEEYVDNFMIYISGDNPRRDNIKRVLINIGFLEEKCEVCNLSEWMNKNIPLELDHIDGNRLNNFLDNLRLLCSNCHAQTDTYCGKNIKNKHYSI